MRIDVVLAFRTVEWWNRAVDIDSLPYRGVSLQLRNSIDLSIVFSCSSVNFTVMIVTFLFVMIITESLILGD